MPEGGGGSPDCLDDDCSWCGKGAVGGALCCCCCGPDASAAQGGGNACGLVQLRACLIKNFTEKRRNLRVTLCEGLSHLLIVVILFLGYRVSKIQQNEAKDYSSLIFSVPPPFLSTTAFAPQQQTAPQQLVNLPRALKFLDNLLQGPVVVPSLQQYLSLTVAVSPIYAQLSSFERSIVASTYAGSKLGNLLSRGVFHFSPRGPQLNSLLSYLNQTTPLIKGFKVYTHNSEADAVKSILARPNERTFALVVLRQVTAQKVNYVIRMNYTTLPNTNTIVLRSALGLSKQYQNYLLSGFMSLQKTVDTWVFSETKTSRNSSFPILNAANPSLNPRCAAKPDPFLMPFPTPDYIANPFYAQVGFLLGLGLTMATLYPVSRLVKSIVEEKETRMREVMKIMGLLDWVHQLSWFITAFVLFLWIAASSAYICSGSLLKSSNRILIFGYFFLFCISEISFSFLLSVFFSNSKLSAIAAPVLLFTTILPRYVFFNTNEDELWQAKYAASLLSPTAFTFGADIIANAEFIGVGVQWSNLFDGAYSFGACCGLMFFDFFLYGVLALYFDQVLPSEFGTPRHPLFFLSLRYWFPARGPKAAGGYAVLEEELVSNLPEFGGTPAGLSGGAGGAGGPATAAAQIQQQQQWGGVNFEPLDKSQNLSQARVLISGLRKVYPDGKVAVKSVSMAMLEGQITCLLGSNGAGKTTTLSILTGLLEATAGDVSIYGRRLASELPTIRQMTGICPQINVLSPCLTVCEHLNLFGSIKGLHGVALSQAIDAILLEVGLTEKKHTLSQALSGGMKRKLSLAMALIGDPKFVLLDEPTSGMDPYSRRSTWELLQRCKAGRVIVLTTHFMDEADTLGDRIMIMSEGRLRCSGSPLFLKTRFGAGYLLSMAKTSVDCDAAAVQEAIQSLVPDASLAQAVAGELIFQLPISAAPAFASLFQSLKENSKRLGVGSYGISITTLEQVFIRLAKEAELRGADGADNEDDIDGLLMVVGDNGDSGGALARALTAWADRGGWPRQRLKKVLLWLWHAGAKATNRSTAPAPSSAPALGIQNMFWGARSGSKSSSVHAGAGSGSGLDTLRLPFSQLSSHESQVEVYESGLELAAVADAEAEAEAEAGGEGDKSKGGTWAEAPTWAVAGSGGRIARAVKGEEEGEEDEGRDDENKAADGTDLSESKPTLLSADASPYPSQIRPTETAPVKEAEEQALAVGIELLKIQLAALLRKRIIIAARDLKGFFFQILLPTMQIVLVLAVLTVSFSPAGRTVRLLTRSYYDRLRVRSSAVVGNYRNSFLFPSLQRDDQLNVLTVDTLNSGELSRRLLGLQSSKATRSDRRYGAIQYNDSVLANVTIDWMWVRTNLPFILQNRALIESTAKLFGFQLDLSQTLALGGVNRTVAVPLGFNLTSFLRGANITDQSTAAARKRAGVNVTVSQVERLYERNVTRRAGGARTTPLQIVAGSTSIEPGSSTAKLTGASLRLGNLTVPLGNVSIPAAQAAQLLPTDVQYYLPRLASVVSVMFNSSSAHSAPIFYTQIIADVFGVCSPAAQPGSSNHAQERLQGVQQLRPTYVVKNHPLPLTTQQTLEIKVIIALFTSLFILIPLCYIPAAFVAFLVKERSSKSLHLQLVSGVPIHVYWIATFIWDTSLYFLLTSFVMIAFFCYGRNSAQVFISTNESSTCVFLLILLYGLSCIPLSYLYSLAFDNHSTAQISIMTWNFVTGFVAVLAYFIMSTIPDTQEAASQVVHFFRFFPPYLVGEGLVSLSAAFFRNLVSRNSPVSYFDWEVAGRPLVFMAVECIGYFSLLLVVQSETAKRHWHALDKALALGYPVPPRKSQPDEDVEAEALRLRQLQLPADEPNAALLIRGLSKCYPPGLLFGSGAKHAVRDISFSCATGERFGLLGINGAGKTTTLGVLTGDVQPTSGEVYVCGVPLEDPRCRQLVGYCPQVDPLLELMTAYETLWFFGRIRGIGEAVLAARVERLIKQVGLLKHAARPCGTYSGGNKRKLSLAVALIGDPKVLFLDEPSTGMDPEARRSMWAVIEQVSSDRSIVLVSHSMEECEALCTRMSVMVSGRLQCLGSAQHIKGKFGASYQLEVRCEAEAGMGARVGAGPAAAAGVDAVLGECLEALPGAVLEERHGSFLRLRLDAGVDLARAFELMEDAKRRLGVEDYSISQATLEQVFIKFARDQEEEKGQVRGLQDDADVDVGGSPPSL